MQQQTTGSAMDRSVEQRLAALARANAVRTFRKQMKAAMKTGGVRAHDVLADPPEEAATMKVWDLLLATPGVGRVKTNYLLRHARVSPSKTLAGMTDRQRDELDRLLRRR